jgi:SpoVK/Ycf46/Vps4 family AAA+-type ATPase
MVGRQRATMVHDHRRVACPLLGPPRSVAPLEAVVELIELAGTSVAVPYGRSDVVEALNVMATNSIATIDPAMLRPGRFDLIIPVGAPDSAGRAKLAAEFLPACDPNVVAGMTDRFTPADFALAAQRAAQLAFDRALEGGGDAVSEADRLASVKATRPFGQPRDDGGL